ncbi:MAG: hypothetical protein ACXWLH_00050 [Candidatus Saccharimonadales bacterium]
MLKLNAKLKLPLTLVLALIIIVFVSITAVRVSSGLGESGRLTGKCGNSPHTHYSLTVKSEAIMPDHLYAKLCDTMTVVNDSNKGRLMAFGPHEDHLPYDGITERYLNISEEFTVTLDQHGTFLIHDHNQPEVNALFTVSK